ncbi:Uncharacterised protein [Vibrio cholerae]|nr:Uncharacterised protein [Vibrio cholerae]CSA64814.1 Uncharacterised protein [Vibrio cholerae]CSB36931.1 Uncharacterised protein [Vibrio cholerae]CSB82350.1 Uncharacterised protein [Vibrio cholerae]CSC03083.1 Uncharacterised protein [Vibrio cholerae]
MLTKFSQIDDGDTSTILNPPIEMLSIGFCQHKIGTLRNGFIDKLATIHCMALNSHKGITRFNQAAIQFKMSNDQRGQLRVGQL